MKLTDEQRQMVVDNLGLAHYAANHFNINFDYDHEEVTAVAYYGLVLAVLGFDENQGAQFSSYAVKAIRRTLYREFMYRYKTKIYDPSYLEDIAIDVDGEGADWESYLGLDSPENEYVNRVLIEGIIKKAESNTAKKVIILRYCYPDMTQAELGKRAGCSQKMVRSIIQELSKVYWDIRDGKITPNKSSKKKKPTPFQQQEWQRKHWLKKAQLWGIPTDGREELAVSEAQMRYRQDLKNRKDEMLLI